MARLILVCGPVGAGKTTYSMSLCEEIKAVKFSIDPWLQALFGKEIDPLDLDFSWIMERVNRCHEQVWEVCEQILSLDGSVVLDLGFLTRVQRDDFVNKSRALNIEAEIHYLDVPTETRRQRVAKRNVEKDPTVYSFDVTDMMFNFMEPIFEVPDQSELANGRKVIA